MTFHYWLNAPDDIFQGCKQWRRTRGTILKQHSILKQYSSLQSILPRFGLAELKDEQKKALFYLLSGKDVFVNLPTGFGKSLIYQLAPLVAEELSRRNYGNIRSGIVLVISPLVSLIKDQVKGLQQRGIKASFIGAGQEEANFKEIVNGEMNIVYSSPEMIAGER